MNDDKNLEMLYESFILVEKLLKKKYSDVIIQKILDKKYQEYNKREGYKGEAEMQPRSNEIDIIQDILIHALNLDTTYSGIFKRYLKDKVSAKKNLIAANAGWEEFYHRNMNIFSPSTFRQGGYLSAIELLKDMGLDIPIIINPEGRPVYQFHILNVYVALNILNQLYKKNNPIKQELIDIILNPKILAQNKKELEDYIKSSGIDINLPEEKIKSIKPITTHETEVQASHEPTTPVPNDRVEMIRKLMQKNQ